MELEDFVNRAKNAARTAADAAVYLAGAAKNEIDLCAEKERLRRLYETLGRRCYQALRGGEIMEEPEREALLCQIDESVDRIRKGREK